MSIRSGSISPRVLGAPVGAVLAGSTEFIERARLLKHMFGGAMRQAGIIAAGGIYALEHNVARLAEDHANAQFLAEGLARIPGVKLVYDTVPTNILFFDVTGTGMTPQMVERGINALGVRMGGGYDGAKVIRAVTHLDVTRDDCAAAIDAVRQVCTGQATGHRAERQVKTSRDSGPLTSSARLPDRDSQPDIELLKEQVVPSCDMLRSVYVHRSRRGTRGGAR